MSCQITNTVCLFILYCSRFCTYKLRIDSKHFTMVMILNMSGENSNKLGEYNFNRSACDRT